MPAPVDMRARAAGVLLSLLVGLVPLLAGCGGTEIRPPQPGEAGGSQRDDAAAALLRDLAADAEAHRTDRTDRYAAARPEARSRVRAMLRNAALLRLGDVSLELIDTGPASAEAVQRFGPDTFAASVQAGWRLPVDGARSASIETTLLFTDARQVRLLGADDAQPRAALWLSAPLTVAVGEDTQVISAGEPAADLEPLLRRAVSDVRRVLTDWRGSLVVEVPADQEQLDAVIGAEPGQYDGIAALTTTADGRGLDRGAVRVFLNPEVFGRLGPQGKQVVVSHEAVHVATAGAAQEVPAWLSEGFADYVALRYAGIPVDVAARQALARVRREGPPDRLPTEEDLSTSAAGLGATYESAWTAVRHLGELYGQRRVIAFYDYVGRGGSVAEAFVDVLGTTEAAFVRSWRRDLVGLAG